MPQPDYDTILTSLRELYPVGSPIEIRRLSTYRGVNDVGYFNDPVAAANAIVNSDHDGIAGTYATLNPVPMEAMARCNNRMVSVRAQNGVSMLDKDIQVRRGLLLDFDPVRLAGISSTDEEHDAALARMRMVADDLTVWHGFPVPALVDSGNGGHIRYITEPMENTDENLALHRMFLLAASKRYSTETVELDTGNFNASRIVRMPGTVARKGEDTIKRPHRLSRLLQRHDPLAILTAGHMRRFVEAIGPVTGLAAPSSAIPPGQVRLPYPEDERLYRRLNDVAKARLHEWVPRLFAGIARPYHDGYRLSAKELDRGYEEDVGIMPTGIKDFGVADMGDARGGSRTPVGIVADLLTNGDKPQAARLLSATLNTPINEFEGHAISPPPAIPMAHGPAVPGAPAIDPFTLGDAGSFAKLQRADLAGVKDEPVDYVVKNVLPAGNHILLSARAKMGKTIFAMQMALCVAHGIPFLDRKVKQGAVLYVAFETTLKQFNRDLREQRDALFDAMGIDMPVAESDAIINKYINVLVPERSAHVRIRDGQAGIAEIISMAKGINDLQLVVVDVIRDLWEKRNVVSRDTVDQQRQQIMEVGEIAVATGAALLSLHHDRKMTANDKDMVDALERTGGTSALTSATDGNMSIVGYSDNAAKDGKQPPRRIDGRIRNGTFKFMVVDYTCQTFIDEDGDEQPRKGVFFRLPDDTEVPLSKESSQTGRKRNEAQDMAIINIVNDKQPITAGGIATILNTVPQNIRYKLRQLVAEGRLVDNKLEYQPFGQVSGGKPPNLYTVAGWTIDIDGKLVLDRPSEIPQLPDLMGAAL